MNWQLTTYGGVLHNGYLWFSNNTFNGLFRMRMENGEIEFVDFFPNETLGQTFSHKKCLAFKDRLYFFPALGNYITIYDVQNVQFSSIEFPRGKADSCSDAVLVDDKIYIFPADNQSDLFCLDTKTDSLQAIPSFRKQYATLIGTQESYLLCRVSYSEGKFIFAFFETDIVATFDLGKESLLAFHTGVPHLFAAFGHTGTVYLTTNNTTEIFQYDFVNSPMRIYSEEEINSEQRRFNQICFIDKTVFALPAFWGYVVKLQNKNGCQLSELFHESEKEKKTGNPEEIEEQQKKAKSNTAVILSFGYLYVSNHLLLFPFMKNFFYEINEEGKIIHKFPFLLTDQKSRCELMGKWFLDGVDKFIYEADDFSLKGLIDVLRK